VRPWFNLQYLKIKNLILPKLRFLFKRLEKIKAGHRLAENMF
jgi:hypothetical protein